MLWFSQKEKFKVEKIGEINNNREKDKFGSRKVREPPDTLKIFQFSSPNKMNHSMLQVLLNSLSETKKQHLR